jgi:outer membrane immunogenic protein
MKILFAGAALAAFTSAAFAADPVIDAGSDWSGYFIGIQGGHSWSDLEYDGLGIQDEEELEGPFGGLYYGRNWQSGDMVYGLEGSVSAAHMKKEFLIDFPTVEPGIRAFTTSRAKIGMAFGNLLIFAAGGVSLAYLEIEGNLGDDDLWALGWTVGGGLEAKLAEHWSARLEYLYVDYARETFFEGAMSEIDVEVDGHLVRGGIAYRF